MTEDQLLDYTDYPRVRQDLRDKVLKAVQEAPAATNEQFTLRVVNPKFSGKDRHSLKDQKKAILAGRSLSDKIVGNYELVDNSSGQVVGRTNQKRIMNLPYLTDRGTYIRNGVEYTVAKQFRLVPGVYTRVTDDGNIESQFNAKPRTGASFRVYMEPSSGHFYMRYRRRKIPLYPVLRAMGMSEERIAKSWGKKLTDKNKILERSPYAISFLKQFRPQRDEVKEELLNMAGQQKQASWFIPDMWKQAGQKSTMPIPENFDVVEDFNTRDFKCHAGGNDWECCWSSICYQDGPTYRGTMRRIWLTVKMPKGVKNNDQSKEKCDEAREWGRKAAATWKRKYLELKYDKETNPDGKHGFEALGEALKSKEMKPFIDRVGFDMTSWNGTDKVPGIDKEAAEPEYDPEFVKNVIGEFSKVELSPRTTRRTLGKEFLNATPDAIMAATSKILRVGQGKADTDSRDSLAYQDVYDISDFLSEKIKNDQGGALRKVLWKLTGRGQDMSKIPPSLLDAHVNHLFTASGVAQSLEEINPSDIYDQNVRVSRLGEGALSSVDVAPKDSRNVQPSYLSFIDPVVAPECYSADTEVFTKTGWKKWPEVKDTDELACMVDGDLKYHRPEHLVMYKVDQDLCGCDHRAISYLVTENHRMWVRPEPHKENGFDPEYRIEEASKVEKNNRKFMISGHGPIGGERTSFRIPEVEREGNTTGVSMEDIPMDVWAPFMGWYLSEGSTLYRREDSTYIIRISQCSRANPENWEEIERILEKLPFNFKPSSDRRAFFAHSRQLAEYLKDFGHCDDKFIPPEIFEASVEDKRFFLEAFAKGDRRSNRDGRRASLCTTSRQLAEDLHRLVFETGGSSVITFEPDEREERYLGCWIVYIHKRTERTLHHRIPGIGGSHYIRRRYKGMLYCASVPGGLLYVRRDQKCGFWCGNSMRIGLDMRFARNVRRGPDRQLYTPMINAKTGKKEWVGARQATEMNIGVPGSAALNDRFVPAMARGKDMRYVRKSDIDYFLPDGDELFSDTANMVPLKSGVKGMRLLMGNKFARQALPLVKREAPLVQTTTPGGGSEEERMGRFMGAVKASKPGTIKSVYKDHIKIGYDDGTEESIDLYDNHPYARKSVVGSSAIYVKKEDGSVWKGSIEDYHYEPGDMTLSYEPSSKRSSWKTITGYAEIPLEDKRLLQIKTRSGRRVVLTEDHSLVVMSEAGELVPAMPYECRIGTKLPIASIPSIEEDGTDYDQGVLDGLYLAEGHVPPSQPNLVIISCSDFRRKSQLMDFFSKMGQNPFINGGAVCFTDEGEAKRLRKTFGHLSHNKRVDAGVLELSRGYRKGLLNGYFSGDGCRLRDSKRGEESIEAFTVSKRLRDGLVDVLASFGIFCSLAFRPLSENREEWGDAFGLRVRATDMGKLDRWYFFEDREFGRIGRKQSSRSTVYDNVPTPKKSRNRERPGHPWRITESLSSCKGSDLTNYERKIVNEKEHLPSHRMAEWSGNFGDWARSDISWDEIVSISEVPRQEYVYDLCVKDSEVFSVDHGLLVHNTFIRNMSKVKAGQKVNKGDVLATSNYTDDKGVSALGTNLRVGYLNYDGKVFEDAIVISESASKKLTSEHMYTTKFGKEKDLDTSKSKFLALFPAKFSKEQIGNMDDKGVVKPGTVVQYGDPLVLAVRERAPTPQSMGRRTRADESLLWKHDFSAVVTDATPSKKGYNVNVRANTPMQEGDKLCYALDTDVLTRDGWKNVSDVTLEDEVATLSEDGYLEYVEPAALHCYRHSGRMYSLETTQVSLLVTDNHKNYVKSRYSDNYELVPAKDHFGKMVCMAKTARWEGVTPDVIEIPEMKVTGGQSGNGFGYIPKIELKPMTYAMILGMFLSEGDVVNHPESGTYGIDVPQIKNKKSRERMIKALEAAGIGYCEQDHGRKIRMHGKQIMKHFERFGKSWERYIPGEVFSYGADFLKELYSWVMWGGGSETGSSHSYCTSSRKLADGLQRLCLHIGYSASVDAAPERYVVRIYRKKNNLASIHGHSRTQFGQKEEWVSYKGTVHCVTMPKNHVIYTRRNGKTVWSGNSGRFGNKGVISEIVPDDTMPKDGKGRPIDVFFSPLGVHSRTNPAQKAEAVLGKVAEKTGKPYVLPGFLDEDIMRFAQTEAQKHGMRDKEDLYDPRTGKTIPKILTGKTYIYKLQHTAESKGKARSTSKYTADEQPAKGGKEGSKHIGDMELQAIMAHGADQVLKDLKIIKGQKNDEFWRQLKLGQTPTQPDTPLVYQKFKSLIRAAGINLHEGRNKDSVFSMTNNQAEDLTADREIKNASTYDAKNLRPIVGGLFDPQATGSMGRGDRWSYIKLPAPMPNPIMVEPIRRILGMKQKEFDDVISGKTEIQGKTGSNAITHLLSRTSLSDLKARALEQIKHGVKSKRDDAVKLFRYIDAMEKHGTKPQDFMMSRVPVLPPMFRPISRQQGMTMVADPNYLYKNMLESIDDYKDTVGLPKEIRNEAWGDIWKSYKTLVGTADPDQEQLQRKNVGGILKQIFGKGSPKYGFHQRRVIGTNIDVSGLGVVSPNPSLKLNQVGMPEKLAWTLYEPFVVRYMVQSGYPATQAAKAVEDHSPAAYKALQEVTKQRPVLVNRAPTLHKYSNMAFEPVLVKGRTVQVSPPIVAPFGMDFDGNCVDFNTEIYLTLSNYSHAFEKLKEEVMRVSKSAEVCVDGTVKARIKIGEFPRIGVPAKDKNGADVYAVPEGVEVLSYDPEMMKVGYFPVTHFTEEKDVQVVEVKTKRKSVTVSDNESMAVFDPETGLVKKVAPLDALGCRVPVLRGTGGFGDEGDFDTGWLYGALAADGWVTGNTLGYSKKEQALRDRVVSLLRDKINDNFKARTYTYSKEDHKSRYGDGAKIHINDKDIVEGLMPFCEPGSGRAALRKHLPNTLLEKGTEECLWGILSGLLDGDCGFSVKPGKNRKSLCYTILLHTSSPRLKDDICFLGMKLGIRTGVTTSTHKHTENDSYSITLSAVDLSRHLGKFRTFSERNRADYERLLENPATGIDKSDGIPVSDAEALILKDMFYKRSSAIYSAMSKSKVVARKVLVGVLDELREDEGLEGLVKRVEAEDVLWEVVKTVEPKGREDVFDLCVTGPKIFAVNAGLIIYDTASFTVPVSKKAVDQARELMMPEKNLLSSRFGKPEYKPSNEYLQGLYFATKAPRKKPVKVFKTMQEAMVAYRKDEIKIDDPIRVLEGG